MARHAGYALAATVGEALINQTIRAEFEDLEPIHDSLLFSLPPSVPIAGGSTVQLSGLALFEQRPKVTLRANPGNTARMQTSAIVYVAGSDDPAAWPSFEETRKLRISGSAQVAIDVEVAADGVFLRWQPAGSSIESLSVELLEGPGVPDWLIRAINSPETREAMNRALRAFGPIRISRRLIDRRISHVQSGDIKKAGLSLFEWFRIDETIGSQVAVRVMDGCVSVGIDLEGRTRGDPGQLVDLRTHAGDSVAYLSKTYDYTVGTDKPILVPISATSNCDVAVLFNADVISAITGSISAQVSGTQISPAVKLISLSARIERFDKPLRGRETGVRVDFVLDHKDVGLLDGHLYLQPYLSERGDYVPNPPPAVWWMNIGMVVLDVPWWMEAFPIISGVAFSAMLPTTSPLAFVGVTTALHAIDHEIGDGAIELAQQLGPGVAIAPAWTDSTLPTKKRQPSSEGLKRITLGSDGLGAQMSIIAPSVRFDESAPGTEIASIRTQLSAASLGNFRIWVELRPDLAQLQDECTVRLLIHRGDTRELVANSEGPFRSHSSVAFSHLTADLYDVDSFLVTVRVWFNRTSMSGLLFAEETEVWVNAAIDRHRPFLTWEPHTAHFPDPGSTTGWWHRYSDPKLHRTATSSQCLAVRQRVERFAKAGEAAPFEYADTLPFAWEELAANRNQVCDYCFFGGPTLTEPYPREDWFCKTVAWPTVPLDVRGTGHVGEEPRNLLGRPDGIAYPLWSGGEVKLAGFRTVAGLDVAELLRPERTVHGDRVRRQDLGRTDVVAFVRSGAVPAGGGGMPSCDWSFDDQSLSTPTLEVRWDGEAGAPRDPHVVASGCIRASEYAAHFGIDGSSPGGQMQPGELISYLLFDLSPVEPDEWLTVSASLPPAQDPGGPERLVQLEAIACLRR